MQRVILALLIATSAFGADEYEARRSVNSGSGGASGVPSTETNVVSYGGTGDNVTDNWQAFTDGLAAVAASATGGTLHIPSGQYRFSRPLVVSQNETRLVGEGDGTYLRFVDYDGPGIVVQPAGITMGTVASGLVGAGAAGDWSDADTHNNVYLNLREAASMKTLFGASAFCIETFVTMPETEDQYRYIVWSGDQKRNTNDATPNSAFTIRIGFSGELSGWATIGGDRKVIFGGTVTPNVRHHIAMDYNGTTLRFLLDGVSVASTTASGTLTMSDTEDIIVGPHFANWPAGHFDQDDFGGQMDSLRISTASRYGATYTVPTQKFVRGADTTAQLVINFELTGDGLVAGDGGGGRTYIPIRTRTTGGQTRVRIEDMRITSQGGGLYVRGTTKTRLRNLRFDAVGSYAIWMENNSYESRMDNIDVTTSSSHPMFGIALMNAVGIFRMDHIQVACPTYPIVLQDAGIELTTAYLAGGTINFIATNPGGTQGMVNAMGLQVTNEDNPHAIEAPILIDNVLSATLIGGVFESIYSAGPLVVIDGVRPLVTLIGGSFHNFDASEAMVQGLTGVPDGSVTIINVPQWVVNAADVCDPVGLCN